MGVGMSDYKELISDLRHYYYDEKGALDAADAIEQLVRERDAAIADLGKIADCRTCGNLTPFCSENPDHCKGYVWRGVQEVEHGKAD